jgi:hypothetical protein
MKIESVLDTESHSDIQKCIVSRIMNVYNFGSVFIYRTYPYRIGNGVAAKLLIVDKHGLGLSI